MRKIEIEAKEAFFAGKNLKKANVIINTFTHPGTGKISDYYLHGNRIAEYHHETKKLTISDCGWKTNTTKGRLNSILPHNYFIYQKDWTWYLNIWGKEEVFTGRKELFL